MAKFYFSIIMLSLAVPCNPAGINIKRIFINEFYGVGGKPFIELARKPQSELSTNLYPNTVIISNDFNFKHLQVRVGN